MQIEIFMPATYLTQEGFQKLQDELDYLRKAKRKEVAERLHEAMEGGELIENAEYEAAKNEQAFVEGRIQELDILLATAQIIQGQHDPTSVQVGDTVVVSIDDGEDEEYTIVGAAEANPRGGKVSNESPLGKALLNHRPGEEFTVETPGGLLKVKLIKTT
jgi:transcription elongation factor GreA